MEKKKKVYTEKQVEKRKKIKETINSMIFPVILCLIILGAVFFVINYQNVVEEEQIIEVHAYTGDDTPIVMQNDDIKFTMDPLTTQFTVEVKSTGKVWSSNPENVDDDSIALKEEKAKLKSQVVMSYSTETGLETTFNSFAQSTENGIYEIEQGADYVKVYYSIGNVEKEYVIPPVITKENFDKWISLMEDKDASLVKEYYKKYDINKLGKKDNKEELVANYPIIEDSVIYVLRDTVKENTRKTMQGIFEAAGYTYEDYVTDKELDLSTKTSDKPIFNVSVIYRLEGDDLIVEVPLSEMEYKKEYPIYTLSVLPYFGAGTQSDKGFMMVPEGGGSIINFNNGKTSQATYYANMYGWDMCLRRDAVVHNTRAYFNAYGISSGNDSFICILEDGRTYASIQADISGRNNSFNFVNAVYSISQREQYEVGDIANTAVFKYIDSLPDEILRQRYSFVDSSSYVDMAKDYGNYLQDVYGDYMTMNTDTEAPIAIEIVGAVDKVRQVLGIPVSKPLKLTTYKEAAEIIDQLSAAGLGNMSVKMTGWCNGGVKQQVLNQIKLISILGGKKDMQNLVAKANDLGVQIYLNGITQYAFDSNIFDGFFSYTDAAKLISKERAELLEYSHVTYAERDDLDPYYLLHADERLKMMDNLVKAANGYNVGVSFENDGRDISADYYKKDVRSRDSVRVAQEDKLKSLDSTKVMINMGNDYAIPYVDMVTAMDLRGSEYTILDEAIPFYQIAVHGYINYTGNPINNCGNAEDELLYSAEYGAGLYYTVMKESAFALQKTLYTEYYGSSIDSCFDDIVATYTRYNKELGHTFNQEMVGHDNLSSTVSVTEYADGTKVYVNYGYTDYEVDGIVVPSRDYIVVR